MRTAIARAVWAKAGSPSTIPRLHENHEEYGDPMPAPITMPQLSDTMTEGTLVKWNKKEGDKVRSGDEIAEVETDKATMPMEAFESGTLVLLKAKEGQRSRWVTFWALSRWRGRSRKM